jgi:hypothetical protein
MAEKMPDKIITARFISDEANLEIKTGRRLPTLKANNVTAHAQAKKQNFLETQVHIVNKT